jgi:hypothetical protein
MQGSDMNRYLPLAVLLTLCTSISAKPLDDARRCPDGPTILFGSAYRLCLPADVLQQSAIAALDDLVIKFADGSFFFGKLITPALDGLPSNFDMRLYPEYALGQCDAGTLPVDQQEKARNSVAALRSQIGEFTAVKKSSGRHTLYLAEGKQHAHVFVVIPDDAGRVLQLGFTNVSPDTLQRVLKGFE